MIVVFDDNVNVYAPTLMAYGGAVWNWLSTLAIIAFFSSEVGLGVERASRAGWLMKPAVYTKDAFEQKTYTGE